VLVVEDFFAAEPDEVYYALLRSLPPAGCRVLSADAPLGVLIFWLNAEALKPKG
jgi:hypothetical protein